MEKIELEILGLSSSQSQIGSFALVLGEKHGPRRLPIIIGGFEAQAIALEIENIKPNRPMTHDLITQVHRAFHIELEEVVITDLKEGVFFSLLYLRQNGEVKQIDARPSDAIAIAVRHGAPIFTFPHILEEAGIIIKDEDEEDEESMESAFQSASGSSDSPSEKAEALPDDVAAMTPVQRVKYIQKLTRDMDQAIANEDYEQAARLRDQITKLESGNA